MKEKVALNFESPLSRPKPARLSYAFTYCQELNYNQNSDKIKDCMARARLACYDKHCSARVQSYGTDEDQVEGYSKEMLYLLLQIQYLDRFS